MNNTQRSNTTPAQDFVLSGFLPNINLTLCPKCNQLINKTWLQTWGCPFCEHVEAETLSDQRREAEREEDDNA